MAKSLPILVSKETYAKFDACIHCGMCLPACPTYLLTGDEADSPRGRIHYMKTAVDGRIEASAMVFEHLDRCLVCRACEPACPSGVEYHDLLEAVRPQVARVVLGRGRGLKNRWLEWMVRNVFPYPKRVAMSVLPLKVARAMGLGGVVERIARMLPSPLGQMAAMLPEGRVWGEALAGFTPAEGGHRGSVILLQGCIGSVVSKALNRACVRVLARNGFDVHLLASEPCCGAMAAHANDPEGAREFARQVVDALAGRDADYFISPIAGCGAQLKALGEVLQDVPGYAERAMRVAKRMRDITEFLAEVGIRPPEKSIERTVTYHDSCHLLNAQHVAAAPRQLLAMIPGLKVVKLEESDVCCGAAGTYNLSQPEMAGRLGERKAGHIVETGAAECVTANVGCQMQIEKSLRAAGRPMRVRHVVEVLAEAYGEGE